MQKLKHLIMATENEAICDSILLNAVNHLPEEYKQPIRLHYFNNLSRKEIATQLDWSYSKVHNRITRGITMLKVELNPAYFDQMRTIATTMYKSSSNKKSI
jgi:DNA-directed RNA polymerase specialized sigma24 family protein